MQIELEVLKTNRIHFRVFATILLFCLALFVLLFLFQNKVIAYLCEPGPVPAQCSLGGTKFHVAYPCSYPGSYKTGYVDKNKNGRKDSGEAVTCGIYYCNCPDSTPPPPTTCACVAPAAPAITAPVGSSDMNPDSATVTWTISGWGTDTGLQPSCSNATGNDKYSLQYKKISGSNKDLATAAPPGTSIGSGWMQVDLPGTTNTYTLYNLDGLSTYRIFVISNNGCSSTTSLKREFDTGQRVVITPPSPSAWLRTQGGDVYGKSLINVLMPGSNTNTFYLGSFLVSNGGKTANAVGSVSKSGYSLYNYKDEAFNEDFVNDLKQKVVAKGVEVEFLTNPSRTTWWSTVKTGTSNAYHVSAFSGADFEIPAGSTCPRSIVVFIEGNLIMNPNFLNETVKSACMFVVTGNVSIKPTNFNKGSVKNGVWNGIVDTIQASFVVDGTFYSNSNVTTESTNPPPNSNKLLVKGFLVTNGAVFGRNIDDPGNKVEPSEEFIYDATHVVYLSNLLGDKRRKVIECGSVVAPECSLLNQ